MNRSMSFLAVGLAAMLIPALAMAQTKPTLGVGEVNPTAALKKSAKDSDQAASLDRLIDSLSQQLVVAFQNTRKFEVIAHDDLAKLLDEQQVPRGVITDPSYAAALPGRIKALNYLMAVSLTDFADIKQGMKVEGTGIVVQTRVVQAMMVLKIYDTTTGKALDALSVPIKLDEKGASRIPTEGFGNHASDDSLIESVAIALSQDAAQRLVDRIFPPRVVGVTDNQVTLNRGEGTGVAVGQRWGVYALGKEMIDPDTGESLGKEEIKVGEIVITDVLPKVSKGKLLGNNLGVESGAVVRPMPAQPDDRGPVDRDDHGVPQDAPARDGGITE
jgi:curli biogenesis system outer membrane secretion channel CsgG